MILQQEPWDINKKSDLIASMILNIETNSLLFEKNENYFNVIDGKQLIFSLFSYLNDMYPLKDNQQLNKIGIAFVGTTFSNLPDIIKIRILEYRLKIFIIGDLTEYERSIINLVVQKGNSSTANL